MKKVILTVAVIVLIFTVYWRQVDYKCLNDCLRVGYSYGYCQDVCSYGK